MPYARDGAAPAGRCSLVFTTPPWDNQLMEGKGRWLVGSALAACAIGTVLVAAAAGGERTAAVAGAPTAAPAPVVDCETRIVIAGDNSPGPKSLAIGPVVFNGLKMWGKFPRDYYRPGKRLKWARVKSPIFIEAGGAPATVILDEQHRGRVDMGLALDQAPYEVRGLSAEVRPCPASSKHRWTTFPAGFRLKSPTCLRISVQVEGEAAPIGPRRVPFGRHSCRAK